MLLIPKTLVVSHSRLLVLLMIVTIIMDNPLKNRIRPLNGRLIWLLCHPLILNLMRQFQWSDAFRILPLPVPIIIPDTSNLFINRYSLVPSKRRLLKHNQAIIISKLKVPTNLHRAVLLGLPLIIIRISATSYCV